MISRRRLIVRGLIAATGIGLVACLAVLVLTPVILRIQIIRAFERAGLEKARFEFQGISPWRTQLGTLSAGQGEQLRIGALSADYSPLKVFRGELDVVRVRDARLTVNLNESAATSSSGPSTPAQLPARNIFLESCILVLQRNALSKELPFDASIQQANNSPAQIKMDATLDGAKIAAHGTVDFANNTAEIQASGDNLSVRSVLDLITSPAPDVSGSVTVNTGVHRTAGMSTGTIHLQSASLTIAGQNITDAGAKIDFKSAAKPRINDLKFTFAGGQVSAEPFEAGPADDSVELAVAMKGLDVETILALVTSGRATGSGKFGGRVPLRVVWPRVRIGEGFVESEGPGVIKLGESLDAFSKMLDQSDPRFIQDAYMQQVKSQILEAMKDFAYERVRADMKPENGELLVVVRLEGRGRTGARQPLNITLNFRGFERGLNAYLAGRSGVNSNR